MKNIFCILVLATIVLSSGCGGGGGGDSQETTDNSNIVYSLANSKLEDVSSISFSVTGTDSLGGTYRGSLSFAKDTETVIDGMPVTPINTLVSLEETSSGFFLTVLTTTYFDSLGNPVKTVNPDSGVECFPAEIHKIPDSAKIGDFGIATSYSCSDGGTQSGTWRLESAGNGMAYFIVTTTQKDSSGAVILREEDSLKINASGEPSSISAKLYLVDYDATLNLSGNRV